MFSQQSKAIELDFREFSQMRTKMRESSRVRKESKDESGEKETLFSFGGNADDEDDSSTKDATLMSMLEFVDEYV